jgi:hypothetical protein
VGELDDVVRLLVRKVQMRADRDVMRALARVPPPLPMLAPEFILQPVEPPRIFWSVTPLWRPPNLPYLVCGIDYAEPRRPLPRRRSKGWRKHVRRQKAAERRGRLR